MEGTILLNVRTVNIFCRRGVLGSGPVRLWIEKRKAKCEECRLSGLGTESTSLRPPCVAPIAGAVRDLFYYGTLTCSTFSRDQTP